MATYLRRVQHVTRALLHNYSNENLIRITGTRVTSTLCPQDQRNAVMTSTHPFPLILSQEPL